MVANESGPQLLYALCQLLQTCRVLMQNLPCLFLSFCLHSTLPPPDFMQNTCRLAVIHQPSHMKPRLIPVHFCNLSHVMLCHVDLSALYKGPCAAYRALVTDALDTLLQDLPNIILVLANIWTASIPNHYRTCRR